ncbi:hypothetical protein ACTXT7_002264 [Hymenolepis weldensis]
MFNFAIILAIFDNWIGSHLKAAEESKDHEEDKRMIYWKRGVTADLENEDFDEESRFAPRRGYRNRFEQPSHLRKKMIYW